MADPQFVAGDEPEEADAAPPRDFRRLRELILERRTRMPKRLVQIAEFAIDRPQEIAFGRVAEVAAQAGVQPSAMIRFAQALGYTGFSDLQAVFLAHARERWPEYRERLVAIDEARGGDVASLLQGFMRAAATSIERLRDTISPDALRRAADTLAGAETIYLLGTRRAFPVAAYLAYALRQLAVRCELVDQLAGLGPEHVAMISPRDALLAVSFTPYAPLTLDFTGSVFRRGVPVVAITDAALSPLAKIATVWLEVEEADHAAFRSLAGTFAVATTLAVAVAAKREAKPSFLIE